MLVKCGLAKKRIIRLLVPILFCVVLFLLFTVANNLFRPVWYDWNNYHTINDFYEEPDNHIEVVFLGSSVVVNSISPVQLYEEYGICSYNLGTEQQPLSASYVLLQEAYNYHAETLKVVVLDTSLLFRIPDKAFYEKAVTNLKTSKIKAKSLASETDSIDNMVFGLVPFFHFHDRWDVLNRNDFGAVNDEVNNTRGLNISLDRLIENKDTMKELGLPAYWYDEHVDPREPDADSLKYFNKIIDFCSLNDIELILSKTPLIGWWDSVEHKAVMDLANENGLPFIDCNFSPYLEELGLQFPLDYVDPYHMNFYGAQKYTHFWGSYLSKMSNIHDVRGQKDYEYMSQQLSGYKSLIRTTELDNIRDIGAYLKKVSQIDHCVVMISLKEEGTGSLTLEQRETITKCGFEKLGALGYWDPYIGIMIDGQVVAEYDTENIEQETDETTAGIDTMYYDPRIGQVYLQSAGDYPGASSIIVGDQELSQSHRGINIVVFDYLNKTVVDNTYFDSWATSLRDVNLEVRYYEAIKNGLHKSDIEGDLLSLYLYNRRYENMVSLSDWNNQEDHMALFQYLRPWLERDRYAIIISVLDDAAGSLRSDARSEFKEIGLQELGELEYQDSYIGIIENGNVLFDKKSHEQTPLIYNGINYSVTSGGYCSGMTCEIIIGEQNYCKNGRGINIVVFDEELEEVASSVSFDTWENEVKMDISESDER